MSSTPGKLLSARYSKQVGVGGVDEDRVQSHTILLVIFHYKNPKAGRHIHVEEVSESSSSSSSRRRANIFTHGAHISNDRGSSHVSLQSLTYSSWLPLGGPLPVHCHPRHNSGAHGESRAPVLSDMESNTFITDLYWVIPQSL